MDMEPALDQQLQKDTHLATICFTWDMMRSSRKSYGNLVVHTPKNLTKHSSAGRLCSGPLLLVLLPSIIPSLVPTAAMLESNPADKLSPDAEEIAF